MSIAAHIVGTPLVALRQIVAAVILSVFELESTEEALGCWQRYPSRRVVPPGVESTMHSQIVVLFTLAFMPVSSSIEMTTAGLSPSQKLYLGLWAAVRVGIA